MGVFKDADDVYTNIGEIFRIAMSDPEIGPKTVASGLTMRFDFTDPDCKLWVDFVNAVVLTGDEVPTDAPSVVMGMSATDANAFWLGKVNLVMAMARGRIRAKGSVPDMLKLLPLAKPLYIRYAAFLEQSGRDDLLAAAK